MSERVAAAHLGCLHKSKGSTNGPQSQPLHSMLVTVTSTQASTSGWYRIRIHTKLGSRRT